MTGHCLAHRMYSQSAVWGGPLVRSTENSCCTAYLRERLVPVQGCAASVLTYANHDKEAFWKP